MSEDLKKAAQRRALVAAAHLEKALAELNAAQADLSSVVGASPICNGLRKVTIAIDNTRRALSREAAGSYAKDPWFLDHEPTQQELRCGHGPRHGCGKGYKVS